VSKRVFLAIDVPDSLKNEAESCIEPFFKEEHARIPKREGWHITLLFCSQQNETELSHLMEAVGRAVSLFKPFYLEPQKVSFMKSRMVWLYFKTSPEFTRLKNMIEKKTGVYSNGFVPHLTLARFKEEHYSNLKGYLPENGIDLKDETKPFLVDHISMYESHLPRDGADYELIKKFNLSETV